MLCEGIKTFSLAFAAMGILMMLGVVANGPPILMGTFVCLALLPVLHLRLSRTVVLLHT
jgi:hypothetical protein